MDPNAVTKPNLAHIPPYSMLGISLRTSYTAGELAFKECVVTLRAGSKKNGEDEQVENAEELDKTMASMTDENILKAAEQEHPSF